MEFPINSHEIQIIESNGQLFIKLFYNGKYQGYVNESHLTQILGEIINHSTRVTMQTSELRIILTAKEEKDDFILNIPIIAATWDMTSRDDIEKYLMINCGEAVERVIEFTPSEQVDLLVERNKLYLVDYIRHELAGRYVLSKYGPFKNDFVERKIKNMSIMQGYNIDLFSKSTEYRHRYITPQLHTSQILDGDKPLTKYMYMGLQKNVPNDKKTDEFYNQVAASDIAYQLLDEAFNKIAPDMHKWYSVKFMPKIISSLLAVGKDPGQPGGPQ